MFFVFCTEPQETCSRCLKADDDGLDEFSSGGVTNGGSTDGPAENTDTDSGGVSGSSKRRRRSPGKKQNRIPRTFSPMEPLVVSKENHQAELMLSLFRKARAMSHRIATQNKRIKEVGNLTLLNLTEAARCLDNDEPVSEEIWRKSEEENYGLYGITVRQAGPTGETIPGTKVTSRRGRRRKDAPCSPSSGQKVRATDAAHFHGGRAS